MLKPNRTAGFTLLELMVAMALASIVMVVILTAFEAQIRGQNSEESYIDMQQMGRAALEIMSKEIRMAGCDPFRTADAGITQAEDTQLAFTLDVENDDGEPRSDGDTDDANETVQYGINTSNNLGRATGAGTLQPLAEAVDALRFIYLTDDTDDDGFPDILATPVADTSQIRSVVVSFVIRSGHERRGLLRAIPDSTVYRVDADGDGASDAVVFSPTGGDRLFRHLQFTTAIQCRNL